ncbi:MAG: hypothetical protein V4736_03905, partial [Bdellovibrionota bacterium]
QILTAYVNESAARIQNITDARSGALSNGVPYLGTFLCGNHNAFLAGLADNRGRCHVGMACP